MAREGLRTLVVAKKSLTEEQYHDFEVRPIRSWKFMYRRFVRIRRTKTHPQKPVQKLKKRLIRVLDALKNNPLKSLAPPPPPQVCPHWLIGLIGFSK